MVRIESKTKLKAEISLLGAQLSRLWDHDNDYLWDANPDIWPKHAPILFPFVGRMPNQQYTYQGKKYDIPLHGFAPTSNFEVVEKTDSSCSLSLIVTDEIRRIYPFDFSFIVTYTLIDNRLEIRYEVLNKGQDRMYYGLGSHPGFNVPINKSLKFEDYYVYFPDSTNIERRVFTPSFLDSHKSIPYDRVVDKKLNLSHDLFDDDAVLLENSGNRCFIQSDLDSTKILVEYPETPWCAIWHKIKMEVPFICIEPWFSIPGDEGENDISKKEDFYSLEKDEMRTHSLDITIIK